MMEGVLMVWSDILKDDKYVGIVAPFKQWNKETALATGEAIGSSSGDSLRVMLLNHVKKQRPNASGSRINAYQIIRKLEQLVKKGNKIEESDYKQVIKLITQLEAIEKSEKSNPANIKFTTYMRIKNGKPKGKTQVRGHWRTQRYHDIKQKMNEYAISPVSDDWYVEGTRSGNAPLFTAKPPLWQALFATPENNSSNPVVKVGLLHILKEYKKEVEK
jgi:hypothetical protein